jgi:ketosteroid isomerase-like protein
MPSRPDIARITVLAIGLTLGLSFTPLLARVAHADAAYEARAAEVAAAETAFAQSMADRDLEAFASFVHPDAVFSGRDAPLIGRDAVVAVWSQFFEGPDAPFSWAPETIQVNSAGDMGMSTGPVYDPSGTWVASFASTWVKQDDGRWLVVFDISPRCPPPPAGD